jgi:hypothetical protein
VRNRLGGVPYRLGSFAASGRAKTSILPGFLPRLPDPLVSWDVASTLLTLALGRELAADLCHNGLDLLALPVLAVALGRAAPQPPADELLAAAPALDQEGALPFSGGTAGALSGSRGARGSGRRLGRIRGVRRYIRGGRRRSTGILIHGWLGHDMGASRGIFPVMMAAVDV